jgi:hypothetical protein
MSYRNNKKAREAIKFMNYINWLIRDIKYLGKPFKYKIVKFNDKNVIEVYSNFGFLYSLKELKLYAYDPVDFEPPLDIMYNGSIIYTSKLTR